MGLVGTLKLSVLAQPEHLIGGGCLAIGLLWYHSAWRPMHLMILGHELTHGLWSVLSGGTAHRLRLKHNSGSVEVSESGPLVTLSPYFFPFYPLLIAGLYALFNLFLDLSPYRFLWLSLVGLSLGLHAGFTMSSLMQKQSDLAVHGLFFSWVTIITLNLLVLAIGLIALGKPSTGQALHLVAENSRQTLHILQRILLKIR